MAIVLVVVIDFGSYLTLQTVTESNVRQALLEQQKQRQVETVDKLADSIASDIELISLRMQFLATEPTLQNGEFATDRATGLLKEGYLELNRITAVEGFNILDAGNTIANTAVDDHRQFIGSDVSERDYVIGARERLQPYVSESFTGLSDRFAFAVAVPIINRESGEYVGTLLARFVLPEFFERYQSDLQISRIIAFDRNQVYIATTVAEFLGLEYWGEQVQTATGANAQLNAAYTSLFSGNPASTLFVSGVTHDERFVAASPVFYGGEQIMSVAITTPTAAIYAQVDDILFAQKVQMVAMLATVVAAVSVLILYLTRWNATLDKNVKKRTAELETANEKLKENDKLQKEFINIAAHELRTPIQPVLGIVEMMSADLNGKDRVDVSRNDIELLARNANRLERLSSQLLEMARIEGGAIHLNLEPVDISTKVSDVISNARSRLKKNVDIRYVGPEKPLTVQADKTRLFEVLSNLLDNAIKFTERGAITISVQVSDDGKEAIAKVIDSGSGIDPEIMPRLFTKFATKSESGTGIGLYISKKIIEAHSGRIWAENNPDGRGATFAFALQLLAQEAQDEHEAISKSATPDRG
jgi:signal transduction histidine kinase